MKLDEMFEILKKEGLNPRYIGFEKEEFKRQVEFQTKYQKCWIIWYWNESILMIGDQWSNAIYFTHLEICTIHPFNKKCIQFTTKKNDWLACVALEKLDWQN